MREYILSGLMVGGGSFLRTDDLSVEQRHVTNALSIYCNFKNVLLIYSKELLLFFWSFSKRTWEGFNVGFTFSFCRIN